MEVDGSGGLGACEHPTVDLYDVLTIEIGVTPVAPEESLPHQGCTATPRGQETPTRKLRVDLSMQSIGGGWILGFEMLSEARDEQIRSGETAAAALRYGPERPSPHADGQPQKGNPTAQAGRHREKTPTRTRPEASHEACKRMRRMTTQTRVPQTSSTMMISGGPAITPANSAPFDARFFPWMANASSLSYFS